MRSFKNIICVVAGFFLMQLVISWSTVTKSRTLHGNDIFIYELHEPYHCNTINYKITFTAAKIYFAVDALGTIVYTDTISNSSKKYNQFVKAITAFQIISRQRTAGPCIGTTTEYFQFYIGTNKQLKGMYSTCSPGFSNLAGNLPAVAALFKALIPGLEEKLDMIREEQADNELCSVLSFKSIVADL